MTAVPPIQVAWIPPVDQRVAEVGPHEEHHRRGGQAQDGDVELLMLSRQRHPARRQVRVPEEPDEQVSDETQHDPDQQDPHPVVRLCLLGGPGGRRGLGLGHQADTSMLPIM
jgi:hypothetical protein